MKKLIINTKLNLETKTMFFCSKLIQELFSFLKPVLHVVALPEQSSIEWRATIRQPGQVQTFVARKDGEIT